MVPTILITLIVVGIIGLGVIIGLLVVLLIKRKKAKKKAALEEKENQGGEAEAEGKEKK